MRHFVEHQVAGSVASVQLHSPLDAYRTRWRTEGSPESAEQSLKLIMLLHVRQSLDFSLSFLFEVHLIIVRYWRLRETSNSRDIDMYLAAKTFRTLRVGLVVDL